MDRLAIIYSSIAAIAVLQSLLMLLLTYENARFFRSRCRSRVANDFSPRVELFVPCKGVETDFDSMVAAVLKQDYSAYAVTFVVESKEDPAYKRLQQLLGWQGAVRTRLVVAGCSSDCGQKVHNLSVAAAQLDASVEVLAFVDSDTLPAPDWLRRLIAPLRAPNVGAVTGYRWFVPRNKGLPGAVLSALNGAVASMLGRHRWNFVWGGTWAVRRQCFDPGVLSNWEGALTDDYPVTDAVHQAGLRVAYEPGCLVASPIAYSWTGLLEFARRQYLITRVYAPSLWCWAVMSRLLFVGVYWGGLILAWLHRNAGLSIWPLIAFPVLLHALGSARALLRQKAVSARRFGRHQELRLGARLDVWAQPLLAVADLMLLLSAAVGRQITWRGIRYRLEGRRRTRILSRPVANVLPLPSQPVRKTV